MVFVDKIEESNYERFMDSVIASKEQKLPLISIHN